MLRTFLVGMMHGQTDHVKMFVELSCCRRDDSSIGLRELYELYQIKSLDWWDSIESWETFVSLIKQSFVVKRNKLVGWDIDANERLCIIDVMSHGRCIVPMYTILRVSDLVQCPDEWVIKREAVCLSFCRVGESTVFYAEPIGSRMRPSIGTEWRQIVTEPDERPRALISLGSRDVSLSTTRGLSQMNMDCRTQESTRAQRQDIHVQSTIQVQPIGPLIDSSRALESIAARQRVRKEKIDIGYVYMMIDSQERVDNSVIIKLGMTGATQTPQDRLVSLRTGNPHLMLGMSVLVATPKVIEAKLHSIARAMADPIECQGSCEFFRLKPHVSLFEMTEAMLKATFAHRLNVHEIVQLASQ